MNGVDNWILGDANGAWDDDWTDGDDSDEIDATERADAAAQSLADVASMVDWIARLPATGRNARDLAIWRAELALRGAVPS